MRICLAFIVMLFSTSVAMSQISLSADTLAERSYELREWNYSFSDSPQMALTSYDDSRWLKTDPAFPRNDTIGRSFPGIGWFRLHFTTDSSIHDYPVAMMMEHYGASEIYFDGTLIKSFGEIKGAKDSKYFNPADLPFIVTIKNPGPHVLAVRYANFEIKHQWREFIGVFSGFKMTLENADSGILQRDQNSQYISFIMALLTGIFAALSFLHLFMFLYYKISRANLFFSLFTLSVAILFLVAFIMYGNTEPGISLRCRYMVSLLIIVTCIMLSGFMNELFQKKKTRFYIIAGVGVLILILRVVNAEIYAIAAVALMISVACEAFFIVIFSLFKKVRGTRIIGSGILLFVIFILAVFIAVISTGGTMQVNTSSFGGQVFIFFMVLAILSIPVSMSVYLAWSFSDINKNLSVQLQQVKMLSQRTLEQEQEKQRMLEGRKEELEKEVSERTAELRTEKEKSDMLLMNILPEEVATELKEKGRADAKQFDHVTVLFTDFKNFTLMSERLTAQELVNEIHYCYSEFDKIISRHGVEKIKTIGDAYMCAGGLPVPTKTNAEDTVEVALEIRNFMLREKQQREARGQAFFEIRIGIHTGPVVAGIVGIKKFAYDIWGDTVNIASRMESSGEAGKVNISGTTYELVKSYFLCTHRGRIAAKNKGEIDMYFVEDAI
jgi:class 3 adenylate cyclase